MPSDPDIARPMIRYRMTPPAILSRRAGIHRLEEALGRLPQVELKVEHHFTDGVYMRTMFIPAGVALVGHIHRHPCLSIVQSGEIWVASERGLVHLVGPVTLHSPAGTKRAGWALKDTLFTTVHANPTNERDVDRLEDFLIAKGYDEIAQTEMGLLGGPDALHHAS
jgi:hypothetical protein